MKNKSKHPLYTTWTEMKRRCLSPNASHYHLYGGRGITVCAEWLDFETFVSDVGDRPEGHTLDRIDGNGNYCPENCKWSTQTEQLLNRRPWKLDATDVRIIKGLLASKVKQTLIALMFDVKGASISAIKHGKYWSHI